MLQIIFDREQTGYEKQENDENLVTSLVLLVVQSGVLSVHDHGPNYETHQKQSGENELTS